MENIKDKSLRQALECSGCLELPKSKNNDDNGFWIRAIVLVRKLNCTSNYALAERRGDGCIIYTRDFGDMSPIIGLLSIHPYLFLDERLIPSTDGNGYFGVLARELGIKIDEVRSYDSSRLVSCAREVAIKRQKERIEADAYADEISRVMDEDSRNSPEFSLDDEDMGEVSTLKTSRSSAIKKRGRKR